MRQAVVEAAYRNYTTFRTQDGALDVISCSTQNRRGNDGVLILMSFWISARSHPGPPSPVTFELVDLEN